MTLPFPVDSLLARYGVSGTAHPLKHDENLVARVDAPGTTFGLRVSEAGADLGRLDLELRWLAALRRDTNLKVPAPIPNLDGNLVTTWGPDARACVLYEWVEGERVSASMGEDVPIELGRVVAALHAHARTYTPTIRASYVGERWDDERFFGPGAWWTTRAREDLGPDFGRIRPAVETFRAAMADLGDAPDHFGLIHSDIHFGNVLRGPNGLGVIDFGDAALGHFAFDLAVIEGEFLDFDAGETFVELFREAYLDHGGDQAAVRNAPAFRTASDLAFLSWVFTVPNPETRREKLRWVPEIVTRLSR